MGVAFCRAALVDMVNAHLDSSGVSATQFGYAAVGDPGFVGKLRRGHDFRVSTIEKAVNYLKNNQNTDGGTK